MSFSPSPIHFEVRVEALQLKKVDWHSVAMALASIVFPFPGGPYKRIPLDGAKSPRNISGRMVGIIIVSFRTVLTSARPLTSSQCTFGELSKIVSSIDFTTAGSKFPYSVFDSSAAPSGLPAAAAPGAVGPPAGRG